MKRKRYYCIIQTLPDGTNYYCGVSKLIMPGGGEAIGFEWGTNEMDAELYLTEEVARKDLQEKLLEDNPFAIISVTYRDETEQVQ